MPITYSVHCGGHFIHAVATEPVTSEEFIEYEVAHAIDPRIKPPVSELLEIRHGAFSQLTMDEMPKVLKRREEVDRPPTPHLCAIVPSLVEGEWGQSLKKDKFNIWPFIRGRS